MEKFDIYGFLFESSLKEFATADEEDPNAPQQAQQQPPQQPDPNAQQEQPPEQTQAEQEPSPQQAAQSQPIKTPFSGMVGETVKDMQYAPTANGGSITIKTDSPLPFIISWEGDSVTVKHQGITKIR